jgi:hypothetical protein
MAKHPAAGAHVDAKIDRHQRAADNEHPAFRNWRDSQICSRGGKIF